MSCAKIAEPIEMPFGIWTQVGTRKPALGGVCTGTIWRVTLNCPCAVGRDTACCQLTLTICWHSNQHGDRLSKQWVCA